ncbi:hypothetical protein LSH36_454g04033 [Paralvinella palmiformis]|uniref:Metalloendopeptidase n=1 Tax=Paralvinella palmiformis TaxID=53620 RepID=A0AAD9MZF7_9ANNE|nr:hypothetical protein LSH36_454g04033 [Paralvinella palmiformis]
MSTNAKSLASVDIRDRVQRIVSPRTPGSDPDEGTIDQDGSGDREEINDPGNRLWEPSSMSRDEWLNYHGMSRDQWENVRRTLQVVDYLEKGGPSRDAGLEPTDRVDEGCLWYTEQQAKEALQDAILDSLIPGEVVGFDVTSRSHADKPKCDDKAGSASAGSDAAEAILSRKKRKIEDFEANPNRKWQNPILYKFDGSHTESEKEIIRNAFNHWQQHTCMRFFEVNSDAPLEKEHLMLTAQGYGCYSFVGKTSSVPQQLNLAPICLTQFGIPVHEIGHALGLWHEHQRIDRDQWIRVIKKNIGYYSSQFWKRKTVSHGVPYDYSSVMHYSGTAGSRNRKPTLEPLDPLYALAMGQRAQLSYLDAKIINLEYCQNECSNTLPVACQRGGYQNPNDCYSCICPDGFGGRYCQQPAPPTRAECGGNLELFDEPKTISSPGFDNPGYYDDFTECSWNIKAPPKHTIKLTFDSDFGVFCMHSESCFHWVEVKYKTDFEYPGPRFCCYDKPNAANLTSETNEMTVIFKSDFPTNYENTRRGFKATIEAIPPDGSTIVKEASGSLSTTTKTPTTTQPPGTHWSKWSGKCRGHQCSCGSCSYETRTRMCGQYPCEGHLKATESRQCDKPCQATDKFIQYTGTFVKATCPVCCPGFDLTNGRCVPLKPNEEK